MQADLQDTQRCGSSRSLSTIVDAGLCFINFSPIHIEDYDVELRFLIGKRGETVSGVKQLDRTYSNEVAIQFTRCAVTTDAESRDTHPFPIEITQRYIQE